MNILFLSTNDSRGGAASVTLRLMEALRRQGVEARMLTARKDTTLPYVRRVPPLRRMAAKIAERIQILLAGAPFGKSMWKLSTASFGADPLSDPWVREADAIVLGWTNQGLLSLRGIERLVQSGKPVLWWMHDYWCATGICHLPGSCRRFADSECGECPFLGAKAADNDLSRRIHSLKRRLYASSGGRLRFYAVSEFQRSLIKDSTLAQAMGEVKVLPHAFPAQLYRISPATDRYRHAQERQLIVCGAASLNDPMKNIRGAVRALNLLARKHPESADNCHVIFFGDTKDTSVFHDLAIPATLAGTLDETRLRELYASAAVVLSSSLSETMGATLMEGLASGAVAVSYDCGGPRDLISHGSNGFLVPVGEEEQLAEAIASALRMELLQGKEGRLRRHREIAGRFDAQAVARTLLSEIDAIR